MVTETQTPVKIIMPVHAGIVERRNAHRYAVMQKDHLLPFQGIPNALLKSNVGERAIQRMIVSALRVVCVLFELFLSFCGGFCFPDFQLYPLTRAKDFALQIETATFLRVVEIV